MLIQLAHQSDFGFSRSEITLGINSLAVRLDLFVLFTTSVILQ